MFYESIVIDRQFICKLCNNRINVPKSMPCGDVLCETCINKFESDFECPLCKEIHKIPEKGFPTQKTLYELIKLTPVKVFRGVLFEKFDSTLQLLKNNINEFKKILECSENSIKSRCEFIREEIEISTESAIEKLNKIKIEILDEVDEFELSTLKNLNEDKHEMDKLLNETLIKYNYWYDHLQKPELEKQFIQKAIYDINLLMGMIKNYKTDYESLVKIGKLIRLSYKIKKLDRKHIGLLKYDDAISSDDDGDDDDDESYEDKCNSKNKDDDDTADDDEWQDEDDDIDGD